MKNLKYISYSAIALLGITIGSCNKLDEFNPGGATADAVWTSPQGFVTAVNAAYFEQRSWYGKEDGIFMAESGTDLWFNQGRASYANQLSRYEGLTPATGNPNRNTWPLIWKGINQCNAGIGRIDGAGFTDPSEKNKRLAELRFLRAFYYWHIVETWGGVMLRTKETNGAELTAQRSPVEDFYALMISDLEFAKDNLPNSWGAEYSRATKKSALGLLARVLLTRAYYSTGAEANGFFTRAKDVALDVIARKDEFGVDMWTNYADLWDPANNKRNKEALYTISNSSVNLSSNYDVNGNRLHMWYLMQYNNKPAMTRDFVNGNDDQRRLQPTLYLLDLFDNTNDIRYETLFQERWTSNGAAFTWKNSDTTTYKKASSVVGQVINPGELALEVTKRVVADKKTVKHVVFDRDDLYLTATTKGINPAAGPVFPAFRKFHDPNRTQVNQQAGYNDIFVIRLAEMHMIAAEAFFRLGDNVNAAAQLNLIRNRATKPGGSLLVTPGMVTADFILEERAREFCGEHIRWFDLKRMKRGADWVKYIKDRNPDITAVADFHWLRPVPQAEIDALLNGATEFKNNPGY